MKIEEILRNSIGVCTQAGKKAQALRDAGYIHISKIKYPKLKCTQTWKSMDYISERNKGYNEAIKLIKEMNKNEKM